MGAETTIENGLMREVKKRGGLCWKFVSPGNAGVTDRLILLPGGRMAFAELKAPGKKPRPLQTRRHDTLEELGFLVFRCVDGPDGIARVCAWMDGPEGIQIGREAAAWRDQG